MGGVGSGEGLGKRQAQCLGDAFAVCRVGAVAVADMALLNEYLRIAHCTGGVLASRNLILVAHQSPQLARLCVVVAIQLSLVVVIYLATDCQRWLFQGWRILPLAIAIRLVAYRATSVIVGPHLTVAMVRVERATRAIYGYLVVVYAQAVALRIAIREQASLQHLIGREANAIDDVHWVERRLLDLGKEILGVAIELQDSHIV